MQPIGREKYEESNFKPYTSTCKQENSEVVFLTREICVLDKHVKW